MGRTGAPFGANFYGVTPDIITDGEGAWATASRCPRSCCRGARGADQDTTTWARPSAADRWPVRSVEAVIDVIESESLLANVRQVSAYIRANCLRRAGDRDPGRGISARPEDRRVRPRRCRAALLDKEHPDRHQRRSARAAAAAGLHRQRGPRRPAARRPALPRSSCRHEALSRSRRLQARAKSSICSRSRSRLQDKPQPPGARRARSSGFVFFNPSLRTLASFQAGHGAPRRQLLRDHARARAPGSSRRASTPS